MEKETIFINPWERIYNEVKELNERVAKIEGNYEKMINCLEEILKLNNNLVTVIDVANTVNPEIKREIPNNPEIFTLEQARMNDGPLYFMFEDPEIEAKYTSIRYGLAYLHTDGDVYVIDYDREEGEDYLLKCYPKYNTMIRVTIPTDKERAMVENYFKDNLRVKFTKEIIG